ncbi:MAG: hypothetical protein ABI480_15480 [Chitinophagaceae bacterium]
MKKIFFLSLLIALAISGAHAQITPVNKTKVKPPVQQVPSKIITPVPDEPKTTPPPPAPPVNKENAGTQNAPVYALTSARVRIRTGNDNKEFPSKVYSTLMAKATPANWRNYIQINLGNEMKINSDTEFGLGLEGAPIPLTTFQSAGLKLNIQYTPNFFADAWKIESITLILEFKDADGNLHPTLGNKTIVFNNAYGFLNSEYRNIDCFADGSFVPMTSVIRK